MCRTTKPWIQRVKQYFDLKIIPRLRSKQTTFRAPLVVPDPSLFKPPKKKY